MYHGCSRTGVGVGNLLGIPLLSARTQWWITCGQGNDSPTALVLAPWWHKREALQPAGLSKQGNCYENVSLMLLKLET